MRLDSIRRWQFLKLSHKQNMVNPGSIHLLPIPPRPFLHHWPWSPGSPRQVSRLALEGDQIQRTATFQKTQGTFENPDSNSDSCISQKRTWGLYVLLSLWYKKTTCRYRAKFSRSEETQASQNLSMFILETPSMNLLSEPKRPKAYWSPSWWKPFWSWGYLVGKDSDLRGSQTLHTWPKWSKMLKS
jgi:hypothetical protein